MRLVRRVGFFVNFRMERVRKKEEVWDEIEDI